MYIVYNSKRKKIYRIVSIVLILLICMFTVASIPKDKEKKANAENKSVVKNDDKLDNMDISLLDSMDEDTELDTPENVDSNMDDNIVSVKSTEALKDSKISEESKSDSDSNETSNSTSTTVNRKKRKSSAESSTETNTSSSENSNTSNDDNTSQREQDETFVPRVYSLNGVIGKTITVQLTGTKNAYTDGVYKYKNSEGTYVEKNWSTELNSSGTGSVTITFPQGASDPQFLIWWAGVWNEDKTVALARECSMVSYNAK